MPTRQKNAIIGCGTHRASGYGCPGEWRCLKAAALGEGKFREPSTIVAFISCECPGQMVIPSLAITERLSEIKPNVIHLSSCLAYAYPSCPYKSPEELATIMESATGIAVIAGTHKYGLDQGVRADGNRKSELRNLLAGIPG